MSEISKPALPVEQELAELKARVEKALAIADEVKVYRGGGKPKHVRMAVVLRGQ